MATDKGFYVHTDDLKKVAGQVDELQKKLTGAHGYQPGCLPDYTERAGYQKMLTQLKADWDGDGMEIFTQAYMYVYQGIEDIYKEINKQLTNLHNACQQTITAYDTAEHQNKTHLKNQDGEA